MKEYAWEGVKKKDLEARESSQQLSVFAADQRDGSAAECPSRGPEFARQKCQVAPAAW